MKSTLKIDYERTKDLSPVIKIIIPKTVGYDQVTQELTPGFNESTDEDVRDKLLRDFLHSPHMAWPNSFFEVKTHFPINGELELTTIGPISEENLFSRFENAILGRLLSEPELIECNEHYNYQGVGRGNPVPKKYDMYYGIKKCFEIINKSEYASNTEPVIP